MINDLEERSNVKKRVLLESDASGVNKRKLIQKVRGVTGQILPAGLGAIVIVPTETCSVLSLWFAVQICA